MYILHLDNFSLGELHFFNHSLSLEKFVTCLFEGPPLVNFPKVGEKSFLKNFDDEIFGKANSFSKSPSRGTFLLCKFEVQVCQKSKCWSRVQFPYNCNLQILRRVVMLASMKSQIDHFYWISTIIFHIPRTPLLFMVRKVWLPFSLRSCTEYLMTPVDILEATPLLNILSIWCRI